MKTIIKKCLALLLILTASSLFAADADMRGAGAPAGGSELVRRGGGGTDDSVMSESDTAGTRAEVAKVNELLKAFADKKVIAAHYKDGELRIFTEYKASGTLISCCVAAALLAAFFPAKNLLGYYHDGFVAPSSGCKYYFDGTACWKAGDSTVSYATLNSIPVIMILVAITWLLVHQGNLSSKYVAGTQDTVVCTAAGLATSGSGYDEIKWEDITEISADEATPSSIIIKAKGRKQKISCWNIDHIKALIEYCRQIVNDARQSTHVHTFVTSRTCIDCGEVHVLTIKE